MTGFGNIFNDIWMASAEAAEMDLPNGEFVAKNAKAFNKTMLIATVIALGIGLPLFITVDKAVGGLFLAFGVLLLLLLPTILSYTCVVNKTSMHEEYCILFCKKTKEILWSDVRYYKIKDGNNKSVVLYNENRKRLISFDATIVGYNRIVKMAKRSGIKMVDVIK